MPKQIVIGFLFSTLLLVVFEYLFLSEMYAAKRPLMLGVGIGGILLSALFFIFFFIKFRRASDDN
ncbi:MAG: hypothetical protein ACO1NX_05650 [Chitinophagaceae bacterium]